jgi:DNA topoisomerase-1
MSSSFKWPIDVTYCAADKLPIRRLRWGKGFTYRNSASDRVSDTGVHLRINSLAIPPAWEDVRIAGAATWHIQAIGRDARGRKQYRYNPRWIEQNKLRDFERLVSFAESLPTIRKYVDGQLRRRQIDKDRVTGIALHLLDRTLIRVGNTAYAELNGSFGLTTLKAKHVKLDRKSIKFSFIGKGGKARKLRLEDPRAARALRHCHELPGQQLLQYRSDTGEVLSLTSSDINEALCSITDESFTAKTFRTWGATSDAFERLVKAGPADSEAEAKRTLNEALRGTAAVLGNTLAVCRKYYVHPAIGESYLGNELPRALGRARNGLSAAESATARFLEQL